MAEGVADVPQSTAVDEDSSNSEKIESADATAVPETLPSEKETNGASKRMREEGEENEDEITKMPKVDDESTKEAEVEMKETEEEGKKPENAKLGPMEFESGEAMFNYFFKFLHFWPPNLNVNKYEHLVLLELLKKGQAEPNKKIGEGIQAFQVRYHPMWKSRCFFLVRVDGTSDDFSFRKCVDHILPLPENMKIPSDGNKSFNGESGGHHNGGSRGGRGGRGGRGHGRRELQGDLLGNYSSSTELLRSSIKISQPIRSTISFPKHIHGSRSQHSSCGVKPGAKLSKSKLGLQD